LTFTVHDSRAYSVEAAGEGVPAPAPPWWEQILLGLPLWIWLLVGGVAVAGAVGAAAYVEEERRRELLLALAARKS